MSGGSRARLGRPTTPRRRGQSAEEDLFEVIREDQAVGWQMQVRIALGGFHDVRRDDDHQLAFIALKVARAEQSTEDRYIAEPRQLLILVRGIVLVEPGNGETLAAGQFDGGVRASHLESRNRYAIDGDRAIGRELAYRWLDLDAHAIVIQHGRSEIDTDAELLE